VTTPSSSRRARLAEVLLALAAAMLACTPVEPAVETKPCNETVARFTADMDFGVWGWGAGVASYGLVRGRCIDDPQVHARVDAWLDEALAEPLVPGHVNQAAPAWTLLDAEGLDFDPAIARDLAEYFAYEHPVIPDNGSLVHAGDQVWVDTMFMTAPLLAKVGSDEGDPALVEAAVTQILAHAALLQDPSSGLFFHAWDASDAQDGLDPHMARAHWGRGTAWAALAAAEVLTVIPDDTQGREDIEAALVQQLEAVLALQDPSGAWHTILDDPNTYLESSATAGLALAIEMAIELGLLDVDRQPFADAARAYLEGQLSPDGALLGTSAGTAASREIASYAEIATDQPRLWGQGLYLALLARPS
jgi:unsaturated rhamnogalacturonyl hydrolase